MAEKKNVVTYSGLKKIEEELQDLKVNKRREIAAKIKEARVVRYSPSLHRERPSVHSSCRLVNGVCGSPGTVPK